MSEEKIIYLETSEEYKAIKWLENKTTNYSDDSLVLHYNNILYYLIINLMKENKKLKGKNQRTEDVLRQILKYCNYLHNDCKYRLNDGHIRKIRKIIRDYFGEDDNEKE